MCLIAYPSYNFSVWNYQCHTVSIIHLNVWTRKQSPPKYKAWITIKIELESMLLCNSWMRVRKSIGMVCEKIVSIHCEKRINNNSRESWMKIIRISVYQMKYLQCINSQAYCTEDIFIWKMMRMTVYMKHSFWKNNLFVV